MEFFFSSNNLDDIVNQINDLDNLFYIKSPPETKINIKDLKSSINISKILETKYYLFPSSIVQSLVFLSNSSEVLKKCWNLYPDHIVFLKNKSNVYDSYDDFIENIDKNENLVFILSVGVFIKNNPSIAMIKQLECYVEVIKRISNVGNINELSNNEINEIILESEDYRIKMSK